MDKNLFLRSNVFRKWYRDRNLLQKEVAKIAKKNVDHLNKLINHHRTNLPVGVATRRKLIKTTRLSMKELFFEKEK